MKTKSEKCYIIVEREFSDTAEKTFEDFYLDYIAEKITEMIIDMLDDKNYIEKQE